MRGRGGREGRGATGGEGRPCGYDARARGARARGETWWARGETWWARVWDRVMATARFPTCDEMRKQEWTTSHTASSERRLPARGSGAHQRAEGSAGCESGRAGPALHSMQPTKSCRMHMRTTCHSHGEPSSLAVVALVGVGAVVANAPRLPRGQSPRTGRTWPPSPLPPSPRGLTTG